MFACESGVYLLMRITQLTPGTGHFYCGNCLRDSALASALVALGHDVTMVPLYLPIVDEKPAHEESPVFMGGINMYLRHKVPFAAKLPRAMVRLLDRPDLLRWSSRRGDMTDAAKHAALTLEVLKGDEPAQETEVDRLLAWMQSQPKPDVVCLCNALLTGIAGQVRSELGVPIICTLHGEDAYLDALPEPIKTQAWQTMRERAKDIDLFIAVSNYYRGKMVERLDLDPDRVVVVHNGIRLDDIPQSSPTKTGSPTIGYLARMCPEKGLGTLVKAFIELKRRDTIPNVRLSAAGVVLKPDRKFLSDLSLELKRAGCLDSVSFKANITRTEKLKFLEGLTVFSVPATYGESFGLYILEALASGVPVVQPKSGAFPEILDQTGGGLMCEPDDPISLADQLEQMLLDSDRALALGQAGRARVHAQYSAERMARDVATVCERAVAESVARKTVPTAASLPQQSAGSPAGARSHA